METYPPFGDTVDVFLQMSQTFKRMLDSGYAHNDIKGDNVCVREGTHGPEAVVIDVGNATPVGTVGPYWGTSDVEQYPWLAPELLLHSHPCCEATDVYGVALIIQEELAGWEADGVYPTHPSMAALEAWIHGARSGCVDERPGLAPLITVLECLRREVHHNIHE